MWTASPRLIVLASALIVFYLLLLSAGLAFYGAFPTDHSWSEMLLNYQGGFLKRSLLGEIAYQIDPVIPAQLFISVLLITTYFLVAAWFIRLAVDKLSLASILFLVSPAAFLFSIYDPRAFGRKDILILAAFSLAIIAIQRIKSTTVAFGVVLAIYLIAGFVIEVAWFYLPLTLLVFVLVRQPSRAWLIRAAAVTLLYAVAIYPIATAKPAGDFRAGIISSWEQIHPAVAQYALCCIGVDFQHAITIASTTLPSRGPQYAISFALGLIPLFLMLRIWRPQRRDWIAFAGSAGAFAMMLGPLVLAADSGRYIYLFVIHGFAFFALTGSQPTFSQKPRDLMIAATIAAIYATTWRMPHFSVGILPGPLLQALW